MCIASGKFKDIVHLDEHRSWSLSMQHSAMCKCYCPFSSKVSLQMHETAPILTKHESIIASSSKMTQFTACERATFEVTAMIRCAVARLPRWGIMTKQKRLFVTVSASVIVLAGSTCRLACCSSGWYWFWLACTLVYRVVCCNEGRYTIPLPERSAHCRHTRKWAGSLGHSPLRDN